MAARALITGGSGLLGRHLQEYWPVDHLEPVLVERPQDDLLAPGAVRRLIAKVKPDVVVHLAWSASGTPGYRSSKNNQRWVAASHELAEECLRAGAFFYATGTSLDARESGDAYSLSKARLRILLDAAIMERRIGWLRPYYVFDPATRRPALVAQAMAAADSGEPVILHAPDSAHDFVHAADVASAIVICVLHRAAGAVDIGSGRLRRVRDLVEALGVRWQDDPSKRVCEGSHHHSSADVRVLRSLGWQSTKTEEFFQRNG